MYDFNWFSKTNTEAVYVTDFQTVTYPDVHMRTARSCLSPVPAQTKNASHGELRLQRVVPLPIISPHTDWPAANILMLTFIIRKDILDLLLGGISTICFIFQLTTGIFNRITSSQTKLNANFLTAWLSNLSTLHTDNVDINSIFHCHCQLGKITWW